MDSFKIFELRDKKVAEQILKVATKKQILITLQYNSEADMYEIYSKDNLLLDENRMRLEELSLLIEDCIHLGGKTRPTKNEIDDYQMWRRIKKIPLTQSTGILLLICGFIYLFSFTSYKESLFQILMIDSNIFDYKKVGPYSFSTLTDIFIQNEWWRILSPIFLHFSILHIVFNLLWLKDLGPLYESQKGTIAFIILLVISGICSNLAQFYVVGPRFGGMSGVIYALIGAISYDVQFKWQKMNLPKRDQGIMIIWFFLCLFKIIPNVANLAHGVGFFVGSFSGAISGALVCRKKKLPLPSESLWGGFWAIVILVMSFTVELYRYF